MTAGAAATRSSERQGGKSSQEEIWQHQSVVTDAVTSLSNTIAFYFPSRDFGLAASRKNEGFRKKMVKML